MVAVISEWQSSPPSPHDVAPVTWLGIQAAVDSEVAERERAHGDP